MKQRHSIDFLFSLSLFMVFVICSFFVLLFQINGYHHIVESGKKAESIHTPLAYVQTMLKTSDEKGMIEVFYHDTIHGIEIKEPASNSILYIYEDQHALKELRVLENVEPDYTAGTILFDVDEFKAVKKSKKIKISMIDAYHQKQELTIPLQCE